MTFLWPVMLILLLVLPVAVVVYMRMRRQRQKRAASYGTLGMLQGAMGRSLGMRRHIPPLFFLLALAVLIFALARPVTVVSLPHIEGTVILAFDVSASMGADDLKPTRMEAAKVAARDFVKEQPTTVQIGVVAFSDSGFSGQAPTNDQAAILAAIDRLTPQRGTSLANGIEASLTAIALSLAPPEKHYSSLTATPTVTPTPVPAGTYGSAVIILLTDGENNENPNPLALAKAAADRGVRIYTVGIGSAAGADLKLNGFTVHTQLDEATLQQVAQITGGTYYNADDEQTLRNIYDNLNTQIVIKPERTEITSLLAGVSIFLLLIGGAFSLLWFSRLP